MGQPVNWEDEVVEDYRGRILIDADNPILAFKASRDRYTAQPRQSKYAGLSYLGSRQSEDALTWNVFRILQKDGSLNTICNRLRIGDPRGILFWTLAPEIDETNAKLQYVASMLIRRFDGRFRGQMTEPDVILLGTTRIAVIECKLSDPHRAPSHLWEGELDSVRKRFPIYLERRPHLIKDNVTEADVAPVYQLIRIAFYAMELGAEFDVEPVVVSLSNKRNWLSKIARFGKSAADLWASFHGILGTTAPRCECIFWQDIVELTHGTRHQTLSEYLATHPCLK